MQCSDAGLAGIEGMWRAEEEEEAQEGEGFHGPEPGGAGQGSGDPTRVQVLSVDVRPVQEASEERREPPGTSDLPSRNVVRNANQVYAWLILSPDEWPFLSVFIIIMRLTKKAYNDQLDIIDDPSYYIMLYIGLFLMWMGGSGWVLNFWVSGGGTGGGGSVWVCTWSLRGR